MLHPISLFFAIAGLVLALTDMLLYVFHVCLAVSAREKPFRALHILLTLLCAAGYGILAFFFTDTLIGGTLSAFTAEVIRWSLLVIPAVSVIMLFAEHEWMPILSGIPFLFSVPLFETAFGDIFIYLLLLMLVFGLVESAVRGHALQAREKRHHTALSYQQAIDSLNDGVLFCRADGTVLLKNQIMDGLCFSLRHDKLINGVSFWDTLSVISSSDMLTAVRHGDSFLLSFAGGNTWSFYRNTVTADGTDYLQITALNITESDELRKKILLKRQEADEKQEHSARSSDCEQALSEREERFAAMQADMAAFTEQLEAVNRYVQSVSPEDADAAKIQSWVLHMSKTLQDCKSHAAAPVSISEEPAPVPENPESEAEPEPVSDEAAQDGTGTEPETAEPEKPAEAE